MRRLNWILVAGLLLCLGGLSFAAETGKKTDRQHLLVQVVKDKTGFRVQQTTLVGYSLPKQRDKNRFYPWRVSVSNKKGAVLFETYINDPSELRGEFVNRKDPSKIDSHHLKIKEPLHFTIRLPLIEGQQITFHALSPGYKRQVKPPKSAYKKLGSTSFPDWQARP
jgi:hypothetical protein